MTRNSDPLSRAQHRAHEWLVAVGEELGTTDLHYTYRVLRAWLHIVRDRLTVDSAAHFGAQLPELLRGVFYEGWVPSRVPVRYDSAEFTDRFAHEARISPVDVPLAVRHVSAALDGLCSPGQLDHVLTLLPADLRREIAAPATPGHNGRKPA